MTQQRRSRTDSSASTDTATSDVRPSEHERKLGETIERLVDEIDAVLLEENAAEFVKAYVQRGGE